MTRTGIYRFVRHADVDAMHSVGWMIVDTLAGTPHGYYSVLMWRCDCEAR